MQFGVRGAIAALVSIIPTVFLTGCETTGSSPIAATGSSSAIANNPHPDLPANFRKQIADFMRTQRGDLGLFPHAFPKGIPTGGAEIGDPNRKLSFGGMQDVVCVRLNHGNGWPDFSVRRAYAFTHGRLDSGTGAFISGQGVLVEAAVCGANPNYKPFPEAEFQPQAQT